MVVNLLAVYFIPALIVWPMLLRCGNPWITGCIEDYRWSWRN
jgi:hypothetical protein